MSDCKELVIEPNSNTYAVVEGPERFWKKV
jgi:hypothetical protein